ncbi:acyltransferase family protein [Caballeronia sp. LZ008]|uniref:acyltransferase family protein n=1 Tax=unclassified Caballeronia TaxID=2646786 RepID=UPI0020284EFF|nr:acyltransferase family protein [Caballeronia sp. LZ008]MDR5797391.1 acyltransferase family protein [Caballeronia sp. LZ008]
MDLRNRTIDAARGIGIVLVVLGHAIGLPEWLFRVIYSCHMPLFFFLSGYLFNGKRSPLEVMRRNSRRLLMPYAVAAAIAIFPSILFGNTTSLSQFFVQLGGTAYSIPRSNLTFYCTPLWFLTCLFCTEAMYAALTRYARHVVHVVIAASLVVGCTLMAFVKGFSPWNIKIAFVALFYFHLGFVAAESKMLDGRRFPAWTLPLCALGWIIASLWNPKAANLAGETIGNPALFLLASICGIWALARLARLTATSRALSFLGKNTLPIFAFNYPLNLFAQWLFAPTTPWFVFAASEMALAVGFVFLLRRIPAIARVFSIESGQRASPTAV